MSTPAPARRKRWWLRLLIAALVLLGLLVAADRIGVAVAESAVADTVQNSQHLANRPHVDIEGFPFLTQLASGHFPKIKLSDDDVVVGQYGRQVRLAHLTVTLHDVRTSQSFKTATADSATADALISYADLSSTLGAKLSYAGSGRVKAAASVLIGSKTITGDVTAAPQIAGSSLTFLSPVVTVDGVKAPASVSSALADTFGAPIALDNLPYSLTVQKLSAGPAGVQVSLSARQLTLHR